MGNCVINMRASAETLALIDSAAELMETTRSSLIRSASIQEAIRVLAAQGLHVVHVVPPGPPEPPRPSTPREFS